MLTVKNPITVIGGEKKDRANITNGIIQKCLAAEALIKPGVLVESVREGVVSPATSSKFYGITNTKCTTTTPGEVWTWGNPYPMTISGLHEALNNGVAESFFPTGTELPDNHNGKDSPLVVGHYDKTDNELRVWLARKNVEMETETFGPSIDYANSTILAFLNGDYLNDCSDELKSVIAEVEVPWYDGSSIQQVGGKWHLPSGINVMMTKNSGEGEPWEYWKNKTGLTVPSDSSNPNRIGQDSSGVSQSYWLRSQYSSTTVGYVGDNGGLYSGTPTGKRRFLPICSLKAK